jgi:hypothetical protein
MNCHFKRSLNTIYILFVVFLLAGCAAAPTTTYEKSGCRGKLTANKKCFAQAKGLDFIAEQRRVLIISDGELKRVFSPKGGKGKDIIGISASGDFLMIHYDNDPEEDFALLFKFFDLQSIFLVGWKLPGHLNFGHAPSTQEIHGKNLSISNGILYLTDEHSQKVIAPGMNMKFTGVFSCGDLLVVHEGDVPESGATYIYYYKDDNSYPIVNLIRGEHLTF